MTRILLATGDDMLDDILKKVLNKWSFSDTVIDLRQHLIRKLKEEEVIPDIIIVHDKLISEYETKLEKDREWLYIFEYIRKHYPQIRIVFMGVRDSSDPFLLKLINLGIYDLFLSHEIRADSLVQQLSSPPSYANVAIIKERLDRSYQANPYEELYGEANSTEIEGDQSIKLEEEQDSTDEESDEEKKNKRLLQELFKWASGQKQQLRPQLEEPLTDEPPQPKVIEKIIEVNLPTLVEPKLVAIGSLYPECGSTWIACHLAQMLASYHIPVGVLEFPTNRPYLYERLNGDQLAPSNWECWYTQIKHHKKIRKGTEWKDGDIYWIPLAKNHHPVDDIDLYDLYALLASSRQIPIVLVDLSSHWEVESVRQLLNVSDEIWMVTKPNPTKWNSYYASFETVFQIYSDKAFVIGNCWTPYMTQKEVLNQFRQSLVVKTDFQEFQADILATISHYDPDLLLQAEMEGSFDLKNRSVHQALEEEFEPLLKRLVPEDYLRQQNNKGGLFKRLLARH